MDEIARAKLQYNYSWISLTKSEHKLASAYVRDTLEYSVKELKRVVELMQKPFTLKQLTDTVEDTLAFDELKGLNLDVDRIRGAGLTHAQIFDLLDRLRRIQKNRSF